MRYKRDIAIWRLKTKELYLELATYYYKIKNKKRNVHVSSQRFNLYSNLS